MKLVSGSVQLFAVLIFIAYPAVVHGQARGFLPVRAMNVEEGMTEDPLGPGAMSDGMSDMEPEPDSEPDAGMPNTDPGNTTPETMLEVNSPTLKPTGTIDDDNEPLDQEGDGGNLSTTDDKYPRKPSNPNKDRNKGNKGGKNRGNKNGKKRNQNNGRGNGKQKNAGRGNQRKNNGQNRGQQGNRPKQGNKNRHEAKQNTQENKEKLTN